MSNSSVLDPAELAASPLADLHVIANELGLDGYRRLRKAELVDAILVAQGGEPVDRSQEIEAPDTGPDESATEEERPARRRSRGGRSRSRQASEATEEATAAGDEADATEGPDDEERPARRRSRGGRGRPRDGGGEGERAPEAAVVPADEQRIVEGKVDLSTGNGSGFVRLGGPDEEDVYLSAAQVKRCELVPGDVVAGPVRPPRRSERYASLIRVDTINGRDADEVSEGARFEDQPAGFPSERFALGTEDPTVKAVEWLTPFGRGSRVTVVGPPHSGKTETLVRLASALHAIEGVDVSVVLAGARPEEVGLWQEAGLAPVADATLGSSPDAQVASLEAVVEQAKRVAARGGDAVVVADGLEGVPVPAARRLLSVARNLVDGGSLTILASAPEAVGGETTFIALDATLTALRRFPAIDLAASGTLRSELLVGEAGAEAIAKARSEALL
jgi:transcription termination factor Rho